MKHKNMLRGRSVQLHNITVDGIYSNYRILKGYAIHNYKNWAVINCTVPRH
jgi:hypothetical protein